MRQKETPVCLLALVVVSASAAAQPHPLYEVRGLGTLGGIGGYGIAINESGVVAGTSQSQSGHSRAFVWHDGLGMTDLGTFGGNASTGRGLNDNGHVVGDADTPGPDVRPFLWENGALIDLGSLGGSYGWAVDVNNNRQVVGLSYTDPSGHRPFIWENGVMSALDARLTSGSANAINDKGQIVGSTQHTPAPGFVWENGVITYLDFGVGVTARDINEQGQVVGDFQPRSGVTAAFIWGNGAHTQIDGLGGDSYAWSITESGVVVGLSAVASGLNHGFIWDGTITRDLNDLIHPCSGWVLRTAHGINESGQIVGAGTLNGAPQPYLLEPLSPCYPDCDQSTGAGVLDIFDFLCFQNAFVTGDLFSDCNQDCQFDIFDFLCFQDAFVAGCP